MKRSLQELDFIESCTKHGARDDVITFIGDILYHNGDDNNSIEIIRSLYAAGYCYYFAKMLEDAFPGGIICLCYPYGHIVYILNGYVYDIDGISSAESDMYIPISEIKESINDFRHIKGLEYNTTEEEIKKIGENWVNNNSLIEAFHF